MKPSIWWCVAACAWPASGLAAVIGFDADPVGAAPPGWTVGMTGRGQAQWAVAADPSAPTAPNVLRQSGRGDFPWIVTGDGSLADGYVEVKFKPLAGKDDQAGGVIWRFKSGDEYYIARANALEGNVSLYFVRNGHRNTLLYVDAADFGGNVKANQWHVLRAAFKGSRITVLLDGRKAIELDDRQIAGPGRVGLWTKADSVTAFDDFAFGGAGP